MMVKAGIRFAAAVAVSLAVPSATANAEDWPPADLRVTLVWNGVVRSWRDELQSSMRTACVVVSVILCQHSAQVTLTEDQ